ADLPLPAPRCVDIDVRHAALQVLLVLCGQIYAPVLRVPRHRVQTDDDGGGRSLRRRPVDVRRRFQGAEAEEGDRVAERQRLVVEGQKGHPESVAVDRGGLGFLTGIQERDEVPGGGWSRGGVESAE